MKHDTSDRLGIAQHGYIEPEGDVSLFHFPVVAQAGRDDRYKTV